MRNTDAGLADTTQYVLWEQGERILEAITAGSRGQDQEQQAEAAAILVKLLKTVKTRDS